MKYYIDYISKNVDKIIAKPSFTYGEILYKFQYDVDLLKYTQMSLKFNITLTDQEIVDYIFTNYIYKSDKRYSNKNEIPKNFKKIKELKIGNVLIYTLYKAENKDN